MRAWLARSECLRDSIVDVDALYGIRTGGLVRHEEGIETLWDEEAGVDLGQVGVGAGAGVCLFGDDVGDLYDSTSCLDSSTGDSVANETNACNCDVDGVESRGYLVVDG